MQFFLGIITMFGVSVIVVLLYSLGKASSLRDSDWKYVCDRPECGIEVSSNDLEVVAQFSRDHKKFHEIKDKFEDSPTPPYPHQI